jgi:threonine dehydratase
VRGACRGARSRHGDRVLIPLAEIEAARDRVADVTVRTPLLPLPGDWPCEIWLKLECLQPIGSFKLRGAANAVRTAPPEAVARGLWTTSAGNMAQGVSWMARDLGLDAAIVVPDHAPRAKLDAIERLGGRPILVPFDTWWEAMETGTFPGLGGHFVHPVRDPAVMAGNGTIGLEVAGQLDRIDAVLIPWGGGGLTTGIASALAALSPQTRIFACEPATAAPVSASLEAGSPVEVDYVPSFVDGAGAKSLLPDMWERARPLLSGAFPVPLADAAAAVRLLAERLHVVAEGAGALALAAALTGGAGRGRVVCIVSGGNIDADRLRAILAGDVPD